MHIERTMETKDEKVTVNRMMFEVTRRCNAKCQHCLRGAAQKVDMSDGVIENALKDVSYINSITFTGGEPSLAVDKILKILQVVKKNGIDVGNFYLVTNGKKSSMSLMQAMIKWYGYCFDNEISSLVISKDQYHKEEIPSVKSAEKLYSALTFYNKTERDYEIKSIINDGLAYDNGIGDRYVEHNLVKTEQGEEIEEIYISALGEILSCCDLSYQRQADEALGNVLKDNLADIFYNKE
jgi:MoaA/NifB/PqqE/SkfB family radical SAM enzyme